MPRKQRMKRNRNPEVGMKNRQLGMSKMANTWYQYYGGQALVLIRKQDGGLAGFQSDPNLIQNLSRQDIRQVSLLRPQHFVEEPKFVSKTGPTQSFATPDEDNKESGSDRSSLKLTITPGLKLPSTILNQPGHCQPRVQSPEILQPKPISGRQLRQKQALIDLLESSFS